SPEWRAMRYAVARGIPARFIDLPQAHQLIDEPSAAEPTDAEPNGDSPSIAPEPAPVRRDPLGWLAAAAGYDDGERFWEQLVEHRRSDDEQLFASVASVMTELRAEHVEPDRHYEDQREAHMRRSIRAAQKEGFK